MADEQAAKPSGSSSLPPTSRRLPETAKQENVFKYVFGVPQAVLDWRPKMPGPKMAAFLSVTLVATGAYIYDRRECDRLAKEYADEVRWMGEEPLEPTELARCVRVLAARVPEDGEVDRAARWFKRYMRPVLVAAGVDFSITAGTAPGGLGRTLLHEFRVRRLEHAADNKVAGTPSLQEALGDMAGQPAFVLQERERLAQSKELDGGYIVLGRSALKEYMWALRKAWCEPVNLSDEARLQGLGLGLDGGVTAAKGRRKERDEELLVRELEREDAKDPHAPFELPADGEPAPAPASEQSTSPMVTPYSTLFNKPQQAPQPAAADALGEQQPDRILEPLDVIPEQPPMLLVPWHHPFGIREWPQKLLHFFNHRSDVKLGGDFALAILRARSRALEPPTNRDMEGAPRGVLDESDVDAIRTWQQPDLTMVIDDSNKPLTGSKDLDFDAEREEDTLAFRKSYRSTPKTLAGTRRLYYDKELAPQLKATRELASGAREPTKAEIHSPPELESDLRAERLDKEQRWRRELEGFAIRRAGSGIAWDDARFDHKLKVFEPLTREDRAALHELRMQHERAQQTAGDEAA